MKALEQELSQEFLNYFCRKAQGRKWEIISAIGFSREEILELRRLTLDDLHQLIRVCSFVKVELEVHDRSGQVKLVFLIDHERLANGLAYIRWKQAGKSLIDQLLLHGATISMMRSFFKINHSVCSDLRGLLGVAGQVIGRPTKVSDAEEEKLWRLWQAEANLPSEAERYLALAEKTGLALKVIWPAVQRWEMDKQAVAGKRHLPVRPFERQSTRKPGGRSPRERERGIKVV